MRRPPINYIVTVTVIAVVWIGAAILAGNYISENAALAEVTPEEFGYVYRIVMTIGAVAAALALVHWYTRGAKDSAASDLAGSRRFWSVWLFILIIASVGCVAGIVIRFMGESFTVVEYLIMLGCASALTWVPYWLCSLVMSPRGVKHAVYGMG